ncbi:YdaS family helix-turn-helix protein [Sphingomonas sp.]|uniref:transcriptional regulator n=1 Tax=Sphingomonas sp. TaxID=28214 RepID=UPI00289AC1F2|nr:YdaS family helix-turn-helix protein [Sphingomonas sp.]
MDAADPIEIMRIAIRRAGSQSALARLLGVSQAAVSKWDRLSKPLPHQHVLKVEETLGLSRHDLRPDLYPRDVQLPAPSAPPLMVPANENGIPS